MGKVKATQGMSRAGRAVYLRACLTLTEDDLFDEQVGLTAQQWQAVGLLVAGKRQVDAARELGIVPETITRWKGEPPFLAALNLAVRDAYSETLGTLRAAAGDALAALAGLLESDDERIRLAAALALVRLHLQLSAGVNELPTMPADVARPWLEQERGNIITDGLM